MEKTNKQQTQTFDLKQNMSLTKTFCKHTGYGLSLEDVLKHFVDDHTTSAMSFILHTRAQTGTPPNVSLV